MTEPKFKKTQIVFMASSRLLSVFLCLLVFTLTSQLAIGEVYQRYFCNNDTGNYTLDSPFAYNLNFLLSNLSSSTIDYGFYNFSNGQNSNKVYAIGHCTAGFTTADCLSCLDKSHTDLTQMCPTEKEAIGWYEACMLRYSSRNIFGQMETQPSFNICDSTNAINAIKFNQSLEILLDRMRSKAASGDSRRKSAIDNVNSSSYPNIYGLAECTPDLSEEQCTKCLDNNYKYLIQYCGGKRGGRFIGPSCRVRYETFRFLSDVAAPSPLSTNTTSSNKGKSKISLTLVIAIVVSVVFIVLQLILICIYKKLRKPQRKHISTEVEDDLRITDDSWNFDFDTIRVATNDFSDANKLGQGGFGAVYKGRLYSGQEIAVKRLSRNSHQGDLEFKNEVLLVAKLQHRNLVRLLGFCIEGTERLLVYEFLHNKSLDYFIFDQTKRKQLDWASRYKIIEGIARGILYLHEDSRLKIIHRDLKAGNILLDEEMNPKITDFGMARLVMIDQTHGATRRVVGTYGYMAPEYAMRGRFSVKSDVFSFGVLIIEIVSGLKISGTCGKESYDNLLTFAWKNWKEGTVLDIVDSSINNGSSTEMMRCIHIGLLCVQENVANRPTMTTIVLMLGSSSLSLPIPSKPAFFMHSLSDMQSWTNDSKSTINEASITELEPR